MHFFCGCIGYFCPVLLREINRSPESLQPSGATHTSTQTQTLLLSLPMVCCTTHPSQSETYTLAPAALLISLVLFTPSIFPPLLNYSFSLCLSPFLYIPVSLCSHFFFQFSTSLPPSDTSPHLFVLTGERTLRATDSID